MKNPSFRSLRPLAFGLASLGLLQAVAPAQFDARITAVEVTQGLQNGNQFLVGERGTFVRVSTILENPPFTPLPLDGLMRVYINGVEVPESPIFSINGPNPTQLTSNLNTENGTLNFFYLPPIATNLDIVVEINPPGPNFVPEGNTSNNTMSTGPQEFFMRELVEFAYSPIDYRPGGGGVPNVPPPTLIEPGMGDNFVQGIFSVSDVDYHRTDAPSKLWTGNLSGSGSALLNSLLVDRNMMVPKPDFLYGWVPGGLPYNGVSFLNSPVSMGNTQSWKHQRTYTHELGHNIGRSHVNNTTGWVGVDVEHHLGLPSSNNLGMIKSPNLFDIMVPGLNTNQAWVRPSMYKYIFNHPTFDPNDDSVGADVPSILITGIWNTQTGEVELSHVLGLPTVPSDPAAPEETAFMVRAYAGDDLVQQLPIAKGTGTDSCADRDSEDSTVPVTEVGLKAILPQSPEPIDRVEITPVGGIAAQTVTLQRSPNAPDVRFLSPGAGGDVSAGQVNVAWTGDDADGDDITYYLRYSPNGVRFTPLATGITENQLDVDLRQLPALVNGLGFFQLLASDGLNTTVVNSPKLNGGNTLFAGGGNDPWVHVVTPDNDNTYQKGTTVFLHSSGWDMEDHSMQGSAIQWTSNVDGPIGSGRVTFIATLSVGIHEITVTATDTDGQMATDTSQIVITDRQLPDTPAGTVVYCTAGTSASGCQASMSTTGTPSATAASGFTFDVTNLEGQKDGIFFFGTNGQQANPWGSSSSFQCVVPPVSRAGLQSGSGTTGFCDGNTTQDMNAYWTSKPPKNPGSGAVVQAQFWFRDPQNTSNQTTSLSDAVEFTMQP